jgi:RNA polymerase sigma factor (sigma-70 family)
MAHGDPRPDPLTEHVDGVRRLARRLVADQAAAEDVAQEALLHAAKRRPREGWRLGAWLGGLVRNKARERARADRRRRAREERAAPASAVPSAADVVARVEVHRRVLAAVLDLPDPYRTVVWLRFFEDRGPRSIARLLGVPRETVRTQLRRGLDQLRSRLDADDRGGAARWSVALAPLIWPPDRGPGVLLWEALHVTTQSKVALSVVGAALLLIVGGSLGLLPFVKSGDPSGEEPADGAAVATSNATDAPPADPALEGLARNPGPEQIAETAPPAIDLAAVDRERDLHGVVVRRDGTPVPGAHLTGWRRRWENGGLFTLRDEKEKAAETRSSVDGSFALRLTPGEVVDLEVRAAGLASVTLARRNAGELARVVLSGRVDLCVTFVDEAGRPVPECPVRLFRVGRGSGREDVREEAVSDESGVAWFRGLTGGLTLTLDAKHRELGHPGWVEVVLPEEGTLSRTLTLPTGRTVRGRVVDAATRLPVAGATVGSNWTASHSVAVAADGRYEYRGWTGKGTSVLTATAPGYVRVLRKVGDLEQVDFELLRGARLTGRVVTPDGTPVVGAIVSGNARPQDPSDNTVGAFPGSVTAADGSFVLEGVAQQHDLLLAVQAEGWGTYSETLVSSRLAPESVDLGVIRLGAEHWLRGVAVDAEGAPVPRVQVYATALRPGASSTDRWSRTGSFYGVGGERFADDLGRFAFRGLVPGRYRVVARPQGQGEIIVEAEVPAEGAAAPVRIVVPDVRVLEVEVVTTEGRPVEGMSISPQGRTSAYHPGAQSDSRGRATLYVTSDVRYVGLGFPSGMFDRFATVGAGSHPVRPGDRLIRFVLEECEPALGRVLDASGNPVPDIGVEALLPDGRSASRRITDEAGLFRCPVPKGRTVTLAVTGSGQRRLGGGAFTGADLAVEGRLHDVRGGDKDLVLTVRPRSSDRVLLVAVLAPDGSPFAGAHVSARVSPLTSVSGRSDASGRVRLEGLPDRPVDVTVDAAADLGMAPPVPGTVPFARERRTGVTPSDDTLTVTLRRCTTLRARVVDARGNGLPQIEVLALLPGDGRPTAISSPDGSVAFLLHPTDDFPLDLEAAHTTPTGLLLLGTLHVTSPDATDLTLVLRRR